MFPCARPPCLPFKPQQQRLPSASSFWVWLVNGELLTALPITPASGLPGKEPPAPGQLPLHKGCTAPISPLSPQIQREGPSIDPTSLHPHPHCFRLLGAHPAPPFPCSTGVAPSPSAGTLLRHAHPASTLGCPALCQAPHDAGSFPSPGEGPGFCIGAAGFHWNQFKSQCWCWASRGGEDGRSPLAHGLCALHRRLG